MRYLEELGYTIIELEPVGTNESVNNDEDYWYDISDEETLEEALEFGNIDSLDRLKDELGYVIIKKQEVNEEMDIDEAVEKLRKKVSPTLTQSINKLGMIMMDVEYNGLRANRMLSSVVTDKEQYDHIVKYVHLLKKVLKGIYRLEKRIERIQKKRRLTDDEQDRFDRLIRHVIEGAHYRFPWDFKGYLAEFDQEEMDTVVAEFNRLVDRYQGKKIIPPKKDKE